MFKAVIIVSSVLAVTVGYLIMSGGERGDADDGVGYIGAVGGGYLGAVGGGYIGAIGGDDATYTRILTPVVPARSYGEYSQLPRKSMTSTKQTCPYGKMPTGCLGFENEQCSHDSYCVRLGGTQGVCCKKRPDHCPVGGSSCGGIANTQCAPGSTCILAPFSTGGTCCKNKPIDPTCPNSAGPCGATRTCPHGFACKLNDYGTGGTCCKEPPTNPTCPNSAGPCGATRTCPHGFACKLNDYGTGGTCCKEPTETPIYPTCPNSAGHCGATRTCPPGFACRLNDYGTGGTCCKEPTDPPKYTCPSGDIMPDFVCHELAGRPCPSGYSCTGVSPLPPIPNPDEGGVCCKDTVPEVCPNGISGVICGTLLGLGCEVGYDCLYSSTKVPKADQTGVCCKSSVPEICPKADIGGICGTKGGSMCSNDYECKYASTKIPISDQEGVCCKIPKCMYGKAGICGGPNDYKCPVGTTCMYRPLTAEGIGKCCETMPPINGICPTPTTTKGSCVFDPKVNCLADKYCPKGQRCCNEGCGKMCKPTLPFEHPKLPWPVTI